MVFGRFVEASDQRISQSTYITQAQVFNFSLLFIEGFEISIPFFFERSEVEVLWAQLFAQFSKRVDLVCTQAVCGKK